jgi:hypothetical protein
MSEENKTLRDAQFRKGVSISFFNASNTAIEAVKLTSGKTIKPKGKKASKSDPRVKVLDDIRFYRDGLLKDYIKYYTDVISSVGENFNPADSVKKLEKCQTKADLKTVWLSFSAEERKHPDVKKVAKMLQTKFNEKA